MAIELQTSLPASDKTSGITFEYIDLLIYGDKLITVTGEPKLRVLEASTGKELYSDATNQFGTFSGISLITPACAVICNSSNQAIYYVDLASPTYAKNQATSGQISRSTPNNYNQIIAGKPDLKLAAYCRQSGGIQLINGNNFTNTSLSPSILSSNTSMCIINKDQANTWLVGTSTGTIVEIASSGSVIQSVSLPVTPVANPPMTTGIPFVSNLVSTGNYVVAASPRALYLINWGASSILDVVPIQQDQGQYVLVLSNAASGFFIAGQHPYSLSPATLTKYYISNNKLSKDEQLLMKTSSNLPSFSNLKIDFLSNKIYSTIDTQGSDGLLIFSMTPFNIDNVSTKIQDASVDVAGRIIRIRDSEFIGRSAIELDTSIPIGGASLPAISGKSYIEIAIKPGPSEKYDVREFLA